MALRRPHRKSRHGCVECKRRRVKCDETRPTCSNCDKRHTECEYGSSTSFLWTNEDPEGVRDFARSSSAATDLGMTPSTENTPSLNVHDLELMMQWCNSTFHTLSRNQQTDPIWRNIVPEEALSHPFLMHGILALAALHLARTGPEASRRASYLNRAVAHQNQALALFRGLLGGVNEDNAKAMFAFAGIVVIYTFGFPNTPGVQDPWTSVDDLYQVLVLTRGVQQVIYAPRDFRTFLSNSSFGPILQVETVVGILPDDAVAALRQLHAANETCGQDTNHELQIYAEVIKNLEEMLTWVYGGMRANTIAGRWAIKLPARFMELLREREPLALVMLSYYGVLLKCLEHKWCFDEWSIRVAKVVWAILDDQWRPLIHWSMTELLGTNYREAII
ncbi:unnamed protein product [Penicillium salamii]|uniref:Zn(2)-C6 fungal-type domain-containing protein n=1 Tax=Penicillium salamii TaxID=1612424 RepID=A0A9W4IN54_9EURO|nr:unnamed protein product [Penicillium salamii]